MLYEHLCGQWTWYWAIGKYRSSVFFNILADKNEDANLLIFESCVVVPARHYQHFQPQSTYLKEYHSVCPLVGIGTLPTPLSSASVPRLRVRGLAESQFRRQEKKLSTLPTLCFQLSHSYPLLWCTYVEFYLIDMNTGQGHPPTDFNAGRKDSPEDLVISKSAKVVHNTVEKKVLNKDNHSRDLLL